MPGEGGGVLATTGLLGLEPGDWIRRILAEAVVGGLPVSTHSNVYETGRLVNSGAGLFFGFSVYNSNADPQFIQLFDLTAAPASGSVPEAVFTAAGTSHLAVSYIFPGRYFRTGIWIGNSSTGPTYTAGGADCFYDCQYA
ncbi:MAG: hypothetical protein ACRDUT_00080 [Mycobacterium sp.]